MRRLPRRRRKPRPIPFDRESERALKVLRRIFQDSKLDFDERRFDDGSGWAQA